MDGERPISLNFQSKFKFGKNVFPCSSKFQCNREMAAYAKIGYNLIPEMVLHKKEFSI